LKVPIHTHFFRLATLTRKLGQTDLLFGIRWGFISRSVCARLQVSVCSVTICPLYFTQNWISAFWFL